MSRPAEILKVDGESRTYREWSTWAKETLGIDLPPNVIRSRIKSAGWPAKRAVTEPMNVVHAIRTRLAVHAARAERGEEPLLTRRGPEGLAPFLRGDAAGAAARAALPKAPPRRKAEP